MKKIVIINHYGITPDLPGATKHYDMAKYFSAQKTHVIDFWMCGYNHHTGKHHSKLKGLKIQSIDREENLNIVRIKSTPYRKSSVMRQLNIVFFDVITAFKILLSKNIEAVVLSVPPISIFNVWATKLKKIKLITDVEDLWPLFLIEMGMNNKSVIKYMEFCANYTYKASDGIAAVSQGMLEYTQERINVEKCMSWLSPLGVKIDEYANKVKNPKLIFEKSWKDDFKVMYVGAHGRANDLYSVLGTIKEFNEFTREIEGKKVSFIFVGDGDQKKNLIDFSRNLRLKNVYFEDAIPGKLVPDYLVHADVCLTNLKKIESFKLVRPNKLFQYMALSKPIICGIWGEAKEIIENANSGIYIDFTSSKDAAIKMSELLSNKEKLSSFRNNGKKYVDEYGNRQSIFKKFYFNILNILK